MDEDSSTEQKTWQVYSFGGKKVFRLHLNESREGLRYLLRVACCERVAILSTNENQPDSWQLVCGGYQTLDCSLDTECSKTKKVEGIIPSLQLDVENGNIRVMVHRTLATGVVHSYCIPFTLEYGLAQGTGSSCNSPQDLVILLSCWNMLEFAISWRFLCQQGLVVLLQCWNMLEFTFSWRSLYQQDSAVLAFLFDMLVSSAGAGHRNELEGLFTKCSVNWTKFCFLPAWIRSTKWSNDEMIALPIGT